MGPSTTSIPVIGNSPTPYSYYEHNNNAASGNLLRISSEIFMEKESEPKSGGGWNVLFFVIAIIIVVGNLKECSKESSGSPDISVSSLFNTKAYKMHWNENKLIIEMPCPTYGFVGINKVGWGKVDVDDLLDDICDNAKKCDYPQCIVCAVFTYKNKDRYGNDIVEKSNLHYLVSIDTSEARKYTSGKYLNENYNITGRIVSEALGVNY